MGSPRCTGTEEIQLFIWGSRSKVSATVLIFGNSRIAKIVNLRFPFLRAVSPVLLGARPKPRDFLRHSSENHLVCVPLLRLMFAHDETEQGSVGTQLCKG